MAGRNRGRGGVGACALITGMMLAGCAGGDNLPEPTGSLSVPTLTRTAARPSTTAPATTPPATTAPATTAPATTAPATTAPGTTATETRTIIPRPSETTATATVTATPTEESTSASPTPTESAAAAASDETTGWPWWLWLLLAAAIAGGIAWFVLAARRRRTWDADFAAKLLEARWAADTLMPSVTDRAASMEEVAQRWRRGKPRLDELLMNLSQLAGTASGAERSDRAAQVSEAVTALNQALDSDVLLRAGTGSTGQTGELDESRRVAQTRADALLDAVEGPQPPPGATQGPA